LIGDLAIRKEKAHLVDNELVEDGVEPIEEEEKEENANLHPAESKAAKLSDSLEFITEDNLKDFTLGDIVMPMIGHDVRMPKNEDLI